MIAPLTKPQRKRDEDYLAFVRALPCRIHTSHCEGHIDPHHIVPRGGGKVGSKTDDDRCLPFCRYHHDEYHKLGRSCFEREYVIDLEAEILKLQRAYRPTVKRERVTRSAKLSITGTCVKGHETKVPWRELLHGEYRNPGGVERTVSFWCQRCGGNVEVS